MALTIVETVGSASANSFVSEAVADAYLEARPNSSTWTGTTAKQQALISATRLLSMQQWQGARVDETQALAWPRQWVVNADAPWGNTYFSTTAIPQWLKDATCELAFETLRAGTTDIFALPATDGVLVKTIDVLSTTYSEHAQKQGLQRYPLVWQLIRPYVVTSGPQVPLVRG